MADSEWQTMDGGCRTVDVGRWTVGRGGGQWTADGRQWAVVADSGRTELDAAPAGRPPLSAAPVADAG